MSNNALPVLPLRDIVVFPHMVVPLFVGREKSVKALEQVLDDEKQILLVTQRDHADDDPNADDLYEVGTLATILQLLKLPDGTVKVLVEGLDRARITNFTSDEEFFEAQIEILDRREFKDKNFLRFLILNFCLLLENPTYQTQEYYNMLS